MEIKSDSVRVSKYPEIKEKYAKKNGAENEQFQIIAILLKHGANPLEKSNQPAIQPTGQISPWELINEYEKDLLRYGRGWRLDQAERIKKLLAEKVSYLGHAYHWLTGK